MRLVALTALILALPACEPKSSGEGTDTTADTDADTDTDPTGSYTAEEVCEHVVEAAESCGILPTTTTTTTLPCVESLAGCTQADFQILYAYGDCVAANCDDYYYECYDSLDDLSPDCLDYTTGSGI